MFVVKYSIVVKYYIKYRHEIKFACVLRVTTNKSTNNLK